MRRSTSTLFVSACLAVACSSAKPSDGPGMTPHERDAAGKPDSASGSHDDAGRAQRDAGRATHDAEHAPRETGASDATTADARRDGAGDSAMRERDAMADGGGSCAYAGAPGDCISTTTCAGMANRTSFAGYCPGPADIECCVETPSTANNPATPAGYMLMQQSQVTSAMTAWAVMILDDPTTYPMFSTTTMAFGTLTVLARVEWHPPDFQNSAIHRGVTLYEPV